MEGPTLALSTDNNNIGLLCHRGEFNDVGSMSVLPTLYQLFDLILLKMATLQTWAKSQFGTFLK